MIKKFIIIVITTLFVNYSLHAGIEKRTTHETSPAATEGLPNSIVGNAVSVITGDFVDTEVDLILPGPEPLVLERTYSSKDHSYSYLYDGWTLLHPTELTAWEIERHKKNSLTAVLSEPSGGKIGYECKMRVKKAHKEPFSMPMKKIKGLTNCRGNISAKTNLKNQNVVFDLTSKHATCRVYSGAMDIRHFALGMHTSGQSKLQEYIYKQEKEEKANGNQLVYYHDANGQWLQRMEAYNRHRNVLYSWMQFGYTGAPNKTMQIQSSDGNLVTYSFLQHKYHKRVNQTTETGTHYYLNKVERKHKADEFYQYTPSAADDSYLQVCLKDRKEGRRLAIEYYSQGDNSLESMPGIHIASKDDWRLDRVKMLKAPIGSDPTLLPSHYFYYHAELDPKTKEILNGRTEVYDALKRKTLYHYTKEHRLKSIEKFDQHYHRYAAENFLWGAEESWQEGFLLGVYTEDAAGNIQKGRFYHYDEKGNIGVEEICGELTGRGNAGVRLANGYPQPGCEVYAKSFEYSKDPLNLLTGEAETNGKKYFYSYVPGTNWIAAKYTVMHDRIVLREFMDYDQNGVCVQKTVDNAPNFTRSDWTYINEMHVTHFYPRATAPVGLPERIDENYYDFYSGQEKLLHRIFRAYTIEGRLIKEDHYDSNGEYQYCLEWQYDDHGNVTYYKDALGQITLSEYDDYDNLTSRQNPGKEKTFYLYDFSNRLLEEKETHDGKTFVTKHRYDLVGNRIATINHLGQETRFIYDEFNRLTQTISPPVLDENGILIQPINTIQYDTFGNPIAITDARGLTVTTTYTIRGQPINIFHPDGTIEKFEYAMDGTPSKYTAPNGTITIYTHDPLGRETSKITVSPIGETLNSLKSTYNGFHLLSTEDVEGRITYYHYNFAGQLQTTECEGFRTDYVYDSLGRISKTIQAETITQNFQYDLLNRVTEETTNSYDEVQFLKRYGYDAQGNCIMVQEGDSITYTQYDKLGQPVLIVDGEGNTTHIEYQYDVPAPGGQTVFQRKITDPLGNMTLMTLDTQGRVAKVIKKNSLGITTSEQEIFYDAAGNQGRILDTVICNGQELHKIVTATYEYNNVNQIISLLEAAGTPEQRRTQYRYNSFGQKEAQIKPDGVEIHYTYDAKGRLASFFSSDGSVSYSYTYNKDDQPLQIKDDRSNKTTTFAYDRQGRLINETLASGLGVNYAYDLLNRPIRMMLPNEIGIEYVYQGAHLKKVQRTQGGISLYQHEYLSYTLAGDPLASQLSKNAGTLQTSYDKLGRTLSIQSPQWQQTDNRYDAVGNLLHTEFTDNAGKTLCDYQYDDLYQLKSETGVGNHVYFSDSLYNRVEKDGIRYTLNALNQLLQQADQEYIYDLNGNLIEKHKAGQITKYSYDALDRLITVSSDTVQAEYTYDAYNRRLSKKVNGTLENFIYQGQNEIGSFCNNQIKELRILGLGLGAELGAAIALELNGECFVPIHDHRGNVTTLLKDQNVCQTYRYTAFGEQQIPETITNPWQYASKRLDPETGFIYYGRRYYVPEIGRWVTSDPLGYQDGPNLYAFVHNNPMTHFDLYGLIDTESTTQKNTVNQSESTGSSMWNWFKDKANAVKESVCDFANSTIDLGKDAYNYTRDSVVNIGVGAIDGGFYSLEHPIDCVTFQTNENPLSSHFVINQDRSCLTYRIGDAIGRGVGIAGQAVTFVETLGAGAVVAQGAKRVVMKQVTKHVAKQSVTKKIGAEIAVDVTKEGVKDIARCAESPIGHRGWELKNALYQPKRNQSTIVNSRQYSGHALDQMQNRGLMPSIIENTIKNGTVTVGKKSGSIAHYDSINNVSVIIDSQNGKVITTGFGQIRQ